jgi:hypothetical protein
VMLTTLLSRVLGKVIGTQLVKKCLVFYGRPKVHFRVHTTTPPIPIVGHKNQSTPSHNISLDFILISSSHILPTDLFPFDCHNYECVSHCYHACHNLIIASLIWSS